jgi:hypothetical protein
VLMEQLFLLVETALRGRRFHWRFNTRTRVLTGFERAGINSTAIFHRRHRKVGGLATRPDARGACRPAQSP